MLNCLKTVIPTQFQLSLFLGMFVVPTYIHMTKLLTLMRWQ